MARGSLNTLSKALLLAACLAGSGAAQASSVNLVQNGDFESGTYATYTYGFRVDVPNDWTAEGNWGTGEDYVRAAAPVGSLALYLDNDPGSQGLAGVSQTISSTVAGQSYTLSMDWGGRNYSNNFLEVLWNGNVVETIATAAGTIASAANANFQTLTLTAIGNDILTILGDSGGGSNNTVDNVSLTAVSAVPLPGTALLFGSGMIGLVGLGRKKRLSRRSPACTA